MYFVRFWNKYASLQYLFVVILYDLIVFGSWYMLHVIFSSLPKFARRVATLCPTRPTSRDWGCITLAPYPPPGVSVLQSSFYSQLSLKLDHVFLAYIYPLLYEACNACNLWKENYECILPSFQLLQLDHCLVEFCLIYGPLTSCGFLVVFLTS